MNNWFGEFPSTWKFERLENYIYEINEKNSPIKTDNILSLTNKLGVVPYSEKGNQGNTAKESLDEYKIAYPNTIVCNCMNVLIGSVGISNYYGCVSPVYYVFKTKDNANLEFINYIFQTTEFQKELRRYANGILEIRLRVSSSNILKRSVPIPTLEEQNKIVEVIKSKEEKINALIKNEEAQIEKLKAYKQALISEAVTKGLDPDVPMKDSGVKEIGLLPKDFILAKASNVLLIERGASPRPIDAFLTDNVDGVNWIKISDTNEGLKYLDSTKTKITFEGSLKSKKIFPGDFILTNSMSFGRPYISRISGCVHDGWLILRLKNKEFNLDYLYYLLSSNPIMSQFSSYIDGAVVSNLNIDKVKKSFLIIPPYEIQFNIANYLDCKCNILDKIIDIHLMQIYKLKNYRQSMIYEYVTGKTRIKEEEDYKCS